MKCLGERESGVTSRVRVLDAGSCHYPACLAYEAVVFRMAHLNQPGFVIDAR
jgi:hypothetical protein